MKFLCNMGCGYFKFYFLLFYCFKFSACLDDGSGKPREYLDELIKDLRNETWDVSEIECKKKTLSLLENVQNYTLWASWVWDSMNVKPIGSFYGSEYQLGNYDQCLTSPVTPMDPELRTQYCVANIKIEGKLLERNTSMGQQYYDIYGKADAYVHTLSSFGQDLRLITWGVCVPASCAPKSVQRFMYQLLRHSQLSTTNVSINIESCEKAETDLHFTIGNYLFFGLMGSLLCVTIISTIYYWIHYSKPSSTYIKVVRCFSVPENYRKLVDTNKEELKVLNGIRFMTSAVVVLLHQTFLVSGAASDNKVEIEKLLKPEYISWLLHSDIVVDTFFMLSGLLLVTSCMAMKEITAQNLAKQLVKRYFRLITTAAVLIFFLLITIKYIGSGPLWSQFIDREENCCRKNWWLSLLMINNYIDTENMCYPVIWSIYCDFHFSIVGIALVYMYSKGQRVGVLIFQAIFLVALILPGIYTELYQFPPLFMLSVEILKDYRNNSVFKEMYIASHNRLAAYLVGMMSGYVLYLYRPSDFKKSISRCWSIVGVVVALGLMIGVIQLGKSYYSREYSRVEAVLYASLNRPLWAFAVGLIVLCCVYGSLPFLDGFLGWFVFRPLSRLTYGIYMVHAVVYTTIIYSVRSPQHIAISSMIIQFLGVLVLSCLISLLLWVFVEAPAANLINLLLTGRKKNKFTRNI